MSGAGTSYSGGGRAGEGGDRALPDSFPVGMRVLLVDDDITCLAVVKRMLANCKYEVTTCSQATKALSLLRENRGAYDIIISDVHMPDMDGFRLLELVGLEMDLPVIMMSADTRFNIVMKGIRHGACDFLIKPVRMAELQNIWQHVVRRKWLDNKETEHSGSVDESDHVRQGNDDAEYGSVTYDGADGSSKSLKKKRDIKEDEDNELDNADPSSSKKPRVVWSVELHQQFVNAVNQLGIDKAVPKRILELMNVPGLTRENVASHLQKFRLYLKRLSGVAQQHSILPNSLCGASSNAKIGHLGGIDFHTLAATGQIPPQTLAALQDELLGRPSRSLPLASINQSVVQQASLQENKPLMLDKGISFAQPVPKGQSIPAFPVWSSNTFGTWASGSSAGVMNTSQDSNMLPTLLHQQQSHTVLPDTSRLINVQPSCLVAPLKSSESFQFRSGPIMANQESPVLSLQRSSNFQVGNTLVPMNQHSVLLASQPAASLQRVDNPVNVNQSSKVVHSQPTPNISLANDPRILNQSSATASSQPFTCFQTVRNPAMTSQNSVVAPSPSSTFQSENNLVPVSHHPNLDAGFVDFSHLSSQLNVGPAAVRQALDGGFKNIVAQSSYPTTRSESSTMTLPTDGNISRQVHLSNGSSSHANGLVCHAPKTSNSQTSSNRGLGSLPVQDQGRSLSFVGKGTLLPSRFVMEDMEFPSNDFTHSSVCIGDDGYLLDQDDFTLNGSIKNGPCATPSFK